MDPGHKAQDDSCGCVDVEGRIELRSGVPSCRRQATEERGCGRQPARVSELPPHTEIFLFVSEHWRWPSRGHLADGKRHLPRPVRRLVLLRAHARLGPCRRHVCDMTPDPAGRDTLPDHPAFVTKQKAGGFGRVSLPSGCGRQPARVSELPPHTEIFLFVSEHYAVTHRPKHHHRPWSRTVPLLIIPGCGAQACAASVIPAITGRAVKTSLAAAFGRLGQRPRSAPRFLSPPPFGEAP